MPHRPLSSTRRRLVPVASVLMAAFLCAGCSERRLVIYPGMSVDEVNDRSNRFDEEQTAYDVVSLERGQETILSFPDVTVFLTRRNDTFAGIKVRAAVAQRPEDLFELTRSIHVTLLDRGFEDHAQSLLRDAAQPSADLFVRRPTDSSNPDDGYYRFLGSMTDDERTVVAFEMVAFEDRAWLDVRFELPYDEGATVGPPDGPPR